MKEIVKLGSILMLTTVVAAVGLSAVYSVTKPRIEAQKQFAIENALTVALPTADKNAIEPVYRDGDINYYKAYKTEEKKSAIGYAYIARGPGYSSVVETMVGVDTTGRIMGLEVLDQKETPGLGTKIEQVRYGESDPWFTRQFIDKKAANVDLKKDGGTIDAITGATISSRAVTHSIADGYKTLQNQLDNKKEN